MTDLDQFGRYTGIQRAACLERGKDLMSTRYTTSPRATCLWSSPAKLYRIHATSRMHGDLERTLNQSLDWLQHGALTLACGFAATTFRTERTGRRRHEQRRQRTEMQAESARV